jgi:hypothetical protein
MIELIKYDSSFKTDWDCFINSSKNGTFLLLRNYMDYHADRFCDCSFILKKKNKIIAVLPGNIIDKTYYSHQGLTYGGLIMNDKTTINDVKDIFSIINQHLKNCNIETVFYKPIPFIYHQIPAQEDIYILHQLKAEKIACNLSSTIFLKNKFAFTESRKGGIRKAQSNKLKVSLSNQIDEFWKILEETLAFQHKTKPVHTVEEIKKLILKLPANIKLYVASINDEVIAGTIVFEARNTIHIQYISANLKAKELGALDLIFDYLINDVYSNFDFFDFGHSCENNGFTLNENLIFQKEGFGARGVVYEIYKYNL